MSRGAQATSKWPTAIRGQGCTSTRQTYVVDVVFYSFPNLFEIPICTLEGNASDKDFHWTSSEHYNDVAGRHILQINKF